MHWLANTLPLQKSSSAHLRVLTYEMEYAVEALHWSQNSFFLDVKINTNLKINYSLSFSSTLTLTYSLKEL